MNNILKKTIKYAGMGIGASFITLSAIAKMKKPSSVYDDEPEQKNMMEGKKVIFVQDANDKENADGIRGHLEAVGVSEKREGYYENAIKRVLDVILSFGGLVVLSPVYLVLIIAIVIDDPGPVLFTQKRVGKNKQYFIGNKTVTTLKPQYFQRVQGLAA